MQIEWRSRTGHHRTANSDAACYFVSEEFAIVGLVDAAESIDSQRFACDWARIIVQAAREASAPIDAGEILENLRAAQFNLRYTYLAERASYSLVAIHRQTGYATVFWAGDCLVGLLTSNVESPSEVAWLCQPHTADTHLSAAGVLIQSANNLKHLITRSINARRFIPPDSVSLSVLPGQAVVMVTDGYWRENCTDCDSNHHKCSDDASRLTIDFNNGSLEIYWDTDVENLISF